MNQLDENVAKKCFFECWDFNCTNLQIFLIYFEHISPLKPIKTSKWCEYGRKTFLLFDTEVLFQNIFMAVQIEETVENHWQWEKIVAFGFNRFYATWRLFVSYFFELMNQW